MTKRRIFVDMDGVLADYNKQYIKLFGMSPYDLREKSEKEYRRTWKTIVADSHFAFLDLHEGAKELINFLNSLKVEKVVLSSAAGFDYYEEIQQQKVFWLKKNNINWTPIIVPGKKYKKAFADKNSFLIDDTVSNVEDFIEAGGCAVLHNDVNTTISSVTDWFIKPRS